MPDSALHVPLFRGLIRQDVDSHAYGYRYEAKAQSPMFSYKDSAEKQGQPQCGQCHDLDTQRYCLMIHEIGDIGPELGVVHEPVV